jgi:D-aminopeptidase
VTRGTSPHFWAAAYEREAEFGGLGEGPPAPDKLDFALTSDLAGATTLAVVATDAAFAKAQMTRIAIMAAGGLALALRPAFGPGDGDLVFAAATARAREAPAYRDLAEIGTLAAECLARAIARGVYAATALPFPGAKPSWRDRWGAR